MKPTKIETVDGKIAYLNPLQIGTIEPREKGCVVIMAFQEVFEGAFRQVVYVLNESAESLIKRLGK